MSEHEPRVTDEQAVVRALGGSPDAFDVLVDRYFGMVFVLAVGRLGERAAAEDLTQEVFLRAYLNLHKLRNAAHFPGWLTQMTQNLATDWQRSGISASRLVQMVALEAMEEEIADARATTAREQLESRESGQQVRDAILRLPDLQRQMVLLHYVEEMSKTDIASRLGIHPSTVGRQLATAMAQLRASLGGEKEAHAWGRLNFSEITGPAIATKPLIQRMEVLDAPTRDIVMLCHVQGMDEALVGRAMGVSAKTVRKSLVQAREVLGMTVEEIAEAAAREFGPPPSAREKTRRTVRSVGLLAPATRRRIQQAADTAPPMVAVVLADSPWQRFVQQISGTFLCFYRRHAMALALVMMVVFGAWAWKTDDSRPISPFAEGNSLQAEPWLTNYTAPMTGSTMPGLPSGFRKMVSGFSTLTDYSPITEHRTNTDGEAVVVREQDFFHRATLSYGVATEVEGPNGEASKVTVIIPGK